MYNTQSASYLHGLECILKPWKFKIFTYSSSVVERKQIVAVYFINMQRDNLL